MQMPQKHKLRVLCLHSFRTSGAIFKQQVVRSGFEEAIHDLVELEFVDAPHTASGSAPDDVAPHFEPPYFQWWDAQTTVAPEGKISTYGGWEASVDKLRQVIIDQGPFDGAMGFSQNLSRLVHIHNALGNVGRWCSAGGALTACAAALHEEAQLTTPEVPPLKFAIVIAGFTPRDSQLAQLFSGPLGLPSLHIIGERDASKRASAQLMAHFTVHTAIWHKQGHVVPRLADEQITSVREFLAQFSAARPRL